MNAATLLTNQALQRPDALALVHGATTRTYGQLADRCLAVAGGLLAQGLERGDRVVVMLPNSPEVVESVWACLAAGLIVVPVNYRLHPYEVAYILRSSGARGLIVSEELLAQLDDLDEPIPDLAARVVVGRADGAVPYESLLTTATALRKPVEVAPEDASWLFYTSGTTGRPKGATWSHRTIRVVVMNYLADVYNIDERDIVLHAAPLTHGSGVVALPAIARGATNVILDAPSFEPAAVFGLVESWRVTHIAFLAPTQIVKLLEAHEPGRFDLSSLRAVCYGGAPIHVEHLEAAMDAFGPVFAQIYGQGEAPITATGLSRRAHRDLCGTRDPRLGSAGVCRTDVEIRVVDEADHEVPTGEPGEILVRGDVVMTGYWGDEEATAEALRGGWLHTGDIGALDDRGYLFLIDRAKDVIITGGNNVYPSEVEEVLISHPAVAEVVVIGVPDAYWGEAVHAVVQGEPGQAVAVEELLDLCASRLAGYKKPKAIDFVEALPQNAYGKILRREVRDRYWQGQTRQVGWSAPTVST